MNFIQFGTQLINLDNVTYIDAGDAAEIIFYFAYDKVVIDLDDNPDARQARAAYDFIYKGAYKFDDTESDEAKLARDSTETEALRQRVAELEGRLSETHRKIKEARDHLYEGSGVKADSAMKNAQVYIEAVIRYQTQ